MKDNFERQIQRERADHENAMSNINAERQKQMEELHDKFKTQMLPAMKEKYQQKYQAKLEEVQKELSERNQSLSQQLEEER